MPARDDPKTFHARLNAQRSVIQAILNLMSEEELAQVHARASDRINKLLASSRSAHQVGGDLEKQELDEIFAPFLIG